MIILSPPFQAASRQPPNTKFLTVPYAGSTKLDETTYDPAGDWRPEWRVDNAGETTHPQSDVPGVASDVTQFDYLQYYDPAGTLKYLTNQYLAPVGTSRHHVIEYSPSTGGMGLKIWTDPLS